jgi:hypothetical protein
MQSKDPGNAGCDDADTGNSPETAALRKKFRRVLLHWPTAWGEHPVTTLRRIRSRDPSTQPHDLRRSDSVRMTAVESDVLRQGSLSENVKTLTGDRTAAVAC